MTLRKREGDGNWKKEVLDCTLCRTRCGRGYERVVRQTTKRMTLLLSWILPVRVGYPTLGVSSTLHY